MLAFTKLAALVARRAHHAAFRHGLVAQQRVLDFRTGDVVARRHDHVVIARLVEQIAFVVLHEGVARQVPAALHEAALALVGQVTAARRALDRQAAHRAVGHRIHVVVHHLRHITRHHLADGAALDRFRRAGHEHVDHFRAADTVDHLDAAGLLPQLAGSVRQGFPGRHALLQ
ncbi:hypothetical protein G6F35_016703 [Rhizopus arrhizus]|nr:hypothetical protein G6F35_016703 [Rhizopus arrhizus]